MKDTLPTSTSTVESLARAAESKIPGPRGACVAVLIRLLHARSGPAYFERTRADDIIANAASLFELIEKPCDSFRVRVKAAGPKLRALETTGPDQPFLLDSLLELLRVRGIQVSEVLHPIVAVNRDAKGQVIQAGPPRIDAELVSVIRIELADLISDAEAESLAAEATEVLKEARVVVQDFDPMLKKLRSVEDELLEHFHDATSAAESEELKEAMAFLEWLRRANFVFLGYRGYDIKGSGKAATVEVEHGSGLGILRNEASSTFATPQVFSSLSVELTERIVAPRVILVHKANSDSRVLRRSRMDYIGVKKLDANGSVRGEHRFLGLFTSRAYNDLPSDIPILRKKLDEILRKGNVVQGSHDHKEIFSIFTSIPKYELFMTDSDRIAETVFAILDSKGRRDVRVAYRPDFLERGISAMVLMPKEKFNADVRVAVQNLLARELQATLVDYRLALSEEPMARLHFYFATKPGAQPKIAIDELEKEVAELIRTWADRLSESLEREQGPEESSRLATRYAKAFPPAYVALKSPETAVADIRNIELALREKRIRVSVASMKQPSGGKVSVLKIYRPGEPFVLSALMPILTNLGLSVLDEQTFRISLQGTDTYLHSFRVLGADGAPISAGKVAKAIEELVPAVIAREADDDALNALVTKAGLDRRQVEVLRAYDGYLRQLGGPWRQRTTFSALIGNPDAAALLIELFEGRFNPEKNASQRGELQEKSRAAFKTALEKVTSIIDDQVLRAFENLILASVRTSHFRRGSKGEPLPAISVKVRCADVQSMPDPRPLFEIFVHSAWFEGVHLRSGNVARGGIRWSSRPDDYRMEILGLMKAQRTKNAVIVPVGAKGGFVLKQPSSPSPPTEEIRKQYEVFIGALLDVTDNIQGGRVVHPDRVVILDEEDPYLVVAADRGTATFSDTANALAAARSFWLGDAFASGGSRGFNHKKEGITARGAWECAKRHFRELGVDSDRQTFTVAGIGDMSGDVFGNGMIYSGQIRLVAAFNHAHVFLDPDPDPGSSFEERKRLFELPRSAWSDYDSKKISEGGGIFRRDSKAIQLSARARKLLEIQAETLNGDELVKAILKMPCDLLFNGGIGTYVKSRTETHLDVSDPSNDAVRIDGADLRARIVAEGGNLGLTQLGRIEYARAGGRLNTDFIDNSAGVDLSDHEVNLKILLARSIERGSIRENERDDLLRAATPIVCEQVLRDNYLQGCVLSLEERRGVLALDEHRFLIEELSAAKLLNRAVETIPGDAELLRLRDSRMGLTRPQLAVLLAYSKIEAYVKVLESGLPDEKDLDSFLVEYFPGQISDRFLEDIHAHRLHREIAATQAVNATINELGVSFFHSAARRTGASFEAIQRAYLVASKLCGSADFHAAMDQLYAGGTAAMEPFYRALERFQLGMESTIQGVLRRRLAELSARQIVEAYSAKLGPFTASLEEGERPTARTDAADVPEAIAARIRAAERVAELMDLADLVEGARTDAKTAVAVWEEAGASLLIDRVKAEAARITRVTAEDIETCASLLELAKDHRRRLARTMLRGLVEKPSRSPDENACFVARIIPPDHKERVRASKVLETARTREPLTPTGLYVVVEALGRMVYDSCGKEDLA